MQIRHRGHAPWVFALAAVACAASPVAAQVVLDGTVNPDARGALPGPDYAIGAELGRTAGGNLFHSFERFGLRASESATFSGPSGIAIENVISRVTGGERSDIDGKLRSEIPGADFWFINPAGVVFGPNAELDVPGSFHVSTADELRFADGATFSATEPMTGSTFTVAAPEAFGFLGGTPGRLTVDGGTLQVAEGEALSLVAGDVRLESGTVAASSVRVAAQQAAGGVPARPAGSPVARDGPVTLTPDGSAGASVLSSGPRGGMIRIEGGEVTVDRSRLFDLNPGDVASEGGIAVAARSLTVVGRATNAGLSTAGTGRGRAGAITVGAPEVRVAGGIISSGLSGSAAAGDITIRADRVELEGGGTISAPVGFEAGPDAKGGTITVSAEEAVTVRDGSRIFTDTFGRGDGGSVVIDTGRLEVLTRPASPGGFRSTVSASTFGAGKGGALDIEAGEILVDNAFISAGAASASTGPGGEIDLTADRVVVRDAGFIETNALGTRDGGSIAIRASDAVEVTGGASIAGLTAGTGRGGTIAITAPRLRLDNGRINASTLGSRRAGAITVRADEVEILDEGVINSSTFAEGNGGDIVVEAGTLVVDATRPDTRLATGIVASATGTSGGAAGNVRVEADDIRLSNGAEISSVTRGRGPGGSLTIAAGSLRVNNAQIIATTEPEAQETADAGSVRITAGTLEILNTGLVSTGTRGPGDGGELTVEAGTIVLDGTKDVLSDLFTGIESAAQEGSTGRSGNITVRAAEVLEIQNDAGIATSTLGPGDGGRLRVEAPVIQLRDNGNIVSSSFSREPGAGQAGRVAVAARERLTIANALIGTESRAAGGGQIELQVGDLLLLTDAGEVSSSVFGGAGTTAGDITIDDPRFIVLDGGLIVAQAKEGRGGNIRIEVGTLFRTPDSPISASAGPAGIDGTVAISAPDQDVTSGLVALPAAFVDASSLLRESCAAQQSERASSFVGVGRGGVAPGPEDLLAGSYAGLIDARTGTATFAEVTPRFEPVGLVMVCGGRER